MFGMFGLFGMIWFEFVCFEFLVRAAARVVLQEFLDDSTTICDQLARDQTLDSVPIKMVNRHVDVCLVGVGVGLSFFGAKSIWLYKSLAELRRG